MGVRGKQDCVMNLANILWMIKLEKIFDRIHAFSNLFQMTFVGLKKHVQSKNIYTVHVRILVTSITGVEP